MHNKITQVKESVVRHKTKVVYGAGVITGIAVTVIVKQNLNVPLHIIAPIPNETLQHLIDNPQDAAHYVDPATKGMITLFNTAVEL